MDEIKTYTAQDYKSGQPRWCPGCGDHAFLGSLHKALAELGVPPHQIAVISGIGCSSRLPYYMNTYGMHTIHGRAAAISTGAKVANPDLTIWQVSGDGDGLAIGGNHFIHALRRNIDLNMILLNNRIYGLTKGQYSPTSARGFVSKSSPYGTVEDPFRPAELCFGARGQFFARCVAVDGKGCVDVLKAAGKHKGASVVEVLQNCIIFNNGTHDSVATPSARAKNAIYLEHGKPMIFGENREYGLMQDGFSLKVVKIGENGVLERNRGADIESSKQNRSFLRDKPTLTAKKEETRRSDLAAIYSKDKEIAAHLEDKGYNHLSLLAQAKEQLRLLSKLEYAEVKTLKLKVDVAGLNKIIRETRQPKTEKEAKTPQQPSKQVENNVGKKEVSKPSKPEVSVSKQAATKPESNVVKAPSAKPDKPGASEKSDGRPSGYLPLYGFGHNIKDSLLDVASIYGLVFRDPSIPYFRIAHGPLDITQSDLANIVDFFTERLQKQGKAEYAAKEYSFSCEQAFKGYRAYVLVGKMPEDKPIKVKEKVETKSTGKPKVEPKSAEQTPIEGKPEGPATKKRTRTKKAVAPKPAEKPSEPKPVIVETAAVPEGTGLMIGVPSDQAKVKIERKARKSDKPLDAAKPTAKKTKKTAAAPKATASPAEKPAAKEPVKKSAKAKASSPKEKKPAPSDFEKASKADKRLKSVVSNSTYSTEKKQKDIKSQISLVKKLKPEEASQLSYSLIDLQALLESLSKSN